MPAVAYVGVRVAGQPIAVLAIDAYEQPEPARPLPLRRDLGLYSDVFDWGSASDAAPGATQLALGLLADHLGDDDAALLFYRAFRWLVVSQLRDIWALTAGDVADAVARLRATAGP